MQHANPDQIRSTRKHKWAFARAALSGGVFVVSTLWFSVAYGNLLGLISG